MEILIVPRFVKYKQTLKHSIWKMIVHTPIRITNIYSEIYVALRNAHSLKITTNLYYVLSNALLKHNRNKFRCYDQNTELFYPHTN